jgi:NAD(P)-dependent dehydrogenase (short-subunit alcohol dehydrogenase family)
MSASRSVLERFDLTGRVVVITGGAGLLGRQHGECVVELGGTAVLLDLDAARADEAARALADRGPGGAAGLGCDITDPGSVLKARDQVLQRFGRADGLVNNAANNPKVEADERSAGHWSRFESFPMEVWNADLAVGLTGAFLCAQAFGAQMAQASGGVILNIASDLGVIAPDQRIYRNPGETEATQQVKPVTYSVVKSGLIGLTRYLATYWPGQNVRANALAPGGVEAGQDPAFVSRLTNLIPMGRMAQRDEYKAAVAFMISDASSYMNGAVVSIDGGRTAW